MPTTLLFRSSIRPSKPCLGTTAKLLVDFNAMKKYDVSQLLQYFLNSAQTDDEERAAEHHTS